MNNKTYGTLPINPNIIPVEKLDLGEFSIEEIKLMNLAMLDTFEKARIFNPTDPELLNSLAVLHFIGRNYDKSVELFRASLNFDKDNYTLWNKLGATLAHLG